MTKMEYNLSKFRINLVPIETRSKVKTGVRFREISFYLAKELIRNAEFYIIFFTRALKSISGITIDKDEQREHKAEYGYYYKLNVTNGVIQFEINYGGKIPISEKNPPTISIQTDPYIPPTEFLEDIKPVVKHLVEKTGFKIYFWDTERFVTVDELYGREGPEKKQRDKK